MRVKAPDGTLIDFPDSMSRDEVLSVMREKYPAPAAPPAPIPAPVAGPPTPTGGLQGGLQAAGRAADDIMRSVASGLTLGAADKIAAQARSITEGGTYEERLAEERARTGEVSPFVSIPSEAGAMMATGGALGLARAPRLLQMLSAPTAGGIYGYNVAEEGDEARSAAVGAAAGGAGSFLGQALSRIISPAASRNPAVQQLLEEGVTPTPGQAAGGIARRGEELLSSVPLLGDAIRAGEMRALREFNETAINRALRPAGITVQGTGREAIEQAGQALSDGYDEVLSGMQATLDTRFADDLADIAKKAADDLPADLLGRFQRQAQNIASLASMRGGTMTGQQAKDIISDLGREAADFGRSADTFQRKLGSVYGELRDAFSGVLQRSSAPESAARLRGLDQAYKNFLRTQNAAARVGAREGVFTPAQLQSAVRQMDSTLRKRGFGRGQAPMQDLSEAGLGVLSRNVPNSGTTDRALMAALAAGGGAGAVVDPITTAAVATGLGVPSLAYTPLLQRLLARSIASRPAGASAAARAAEGLGLGAGLGAASFLAGP